MKIKNNFLKGLVKRVLNDKAEGNNNKMTYGYYEKLIKDDGVSSQLNIKYLR